MTALEICLIVVGLAALIISYLISDKEAEAKLKKAANNYVLSDDTKENLKSQMREAVQQVLENMSGNISERTEIELEKLSNEKIMAVHEYSDTVLNEINKNHNEVMFLYNMLDDKDKEIKETVREVQSTARSIKHLTDQAEKQKEQLGQEILRLESGLEKEIEEQVERQMEDKLNQHLSKQAANLYDITEEKKETDTDIEEKDTKEEHERDRQAVDEEDIEKEKIEIQPQDVESYHKNNNDIILKLYHEDKSIVDIAKELGLGTGEVKLVIDLNSSVDMREEKE